MTRSTFDSQTSTYSWRRSVSGRPATGSPRGSAGGDGRNTARQGDFSPCSADETCQRGGRGGCRGQAARHEPWPAAPRTAVPHSFEVNAAFARRFAGGAARCWRDAFSWLRRGGYRRSPVGAAMLAFAVPRRPATGGGDPRLVADGRGGGVRRSARGAGDGVGAARTSARARERARARASCPKTVRCAGARARRHVAVEARGVLRWTGDLRRPTAKRASWRGG